MTGEHNDQKAEKPQADTFGHDDQWMEQVMENAGYNHAVENGSPHGLRLVAGKTEKPAKVSLKEKLEAYKMQVAGVGNVGTDKTKEKEAAI